MRKQLTIRMILLAGMASLLTIVHCCPVVAYSSQDIVFKGVYEAALDIPRIYFLVKRQAHNPPLTPESGFEVNYGFLDTGASGILLSKQTASRLGISTDPEAVYYDIGIGGKEAFKISEPLYLGIADYNIKDPCKIDNYMIRGPGRVQIRKDSAGFLSQPVDIIGMPMIIDQIVVLNSEATNSLGYFAAEIKQAENSQLPKMDVKVALELRKFVDPQNPDNIPPLPSRAFNPVIKNIKLTYKGKSSSGNWLLDTGATTSFISTRQATKLGILNENGKSIVKPDFSLPVGGIGDMIQLQGFELGAMSIPTLSGNNIVFKNPRLAVHDIKYFDREEGKYKVLDGVLGSNFLCSSAKMEGLLPSEIGKTPFEHIVIDMRNQLLGFDLIK